MRILIDPGHGGRDPGATVHDVTEAEVVLPYAFALGAALVGRGHAVRFTRMEDVDLAPEAAWPSPGKARDMSRRVTQADQWKAEVFISIHANAAAAQAANGAWVIYDDNTKTGDELARAVFAAMAKVPGIPDADATAEVFPDKSAWVGNRELYVISETACPAILVELGFLTNPDDLKQLQQWHTVTAVAHAIASGLDTWAAQRN